ETFPHSDRAIPDTGWALVALGAGGIVATIVTDGLRRRVYRTLALLLAVVPGAIWLAATVRAAATSIPPTTRAVSTIVAALAFDDFDRRHHRAGAQWLLFAVSAFGIYVGVPDTDLARIVLAVALPFALLSVPAPLAQFGSAGAPALAGLI